MSETTETVDENEGNYDSFVPDDYLDVRPFTLIAAHEKEAIEAAIMEHSELTPEQFIISSWGFPVVPIPEPRKANGRLRLAPSNVSNTMLGHPIYWIDPRLTDPRDGETVDNWAIRMFYLILGFELWTADYKWIDVLLESSLDDQALRQSEIDAYHIKSNPASTLDQVPLLGEEHLKIPMARLDQLTQEAVDKVQVLLTDEFQEYITDQITAYSEAHQMFQGDLMNPDLTPMSTTGEWSTKIYPLWLGLATQYNELLDQGQVHIASLTKPLLEAHQQMLEHLKRLDEIIILLSTAALQDGTVPTESYTKIITYLEIAAQQASAAGGEYDLTDEISRALSVDAKRDALSPIISKMYENYSHAWQRVLLAVVNYDKVIEGQEPFASWPEFEMARSNIGFTSTQPSSDDDDMSEIARLLRED